MGKKSEKGGGEVGCLCSKKKGESQDKRGGDDYSERGKTSRCASFQAATEGPDLQKKTFQMGGPSTAKRRLGQPGGKGKRGLLSGLLAEGGQRGQRTVPITSGPVGFRRE